MGNNRLVKHLLIPLILPLLFFADAFTPVALLGCRNRGLIALAIALISGIAALAVSVMGAKKRLAGDPSFKWWLLTTVILVIPVIALLILA